MTAPRVFKREYPDEPGDVLFVRGVVAANGATYERISPDVWVPTKGRGGYTWQGLLDAYPTGVFPVVSPEQAVAGDDLRSVQATWLPESDIPHG